MTAPRLPLLSSPTRSKLRAVRLAACAALLSLALASPSLAAPIRYDFSSGFVTLTASVGGVIITDPVTAALDGLQVTVDEDAPELTSIELTATGPISIAFSPAYLGFSEVTLESLSISGSSGLLVPLTPAPPSAEYFFLVDPLDVELVVSGSGSTELVSAPISGSGPGSGSLFITPELQELSLSGITLAELQIAGQEVSPLVLKADFVFAGSPVPEPTAALLFAIGMTVVSASRSTSLRRYTT